MATSMLLELFKQTIRAFFYFFSHFLSILPFYFFFKKTHNHVQYILGILIFFQFFVDLFFKNFSIGLLFPPSPPPPPITMLLIVFVLIKTKQCIADKKQQTNSSEDRRQTDKQTFGKQTKY